MERQNEGRVSGVTTGGLGEVLVVGGDDEAEEEERDHVEEGDTPEHLLGGLGDRLSWVGGFCCGETHQLSSTEGKGGSDEHGAETLEAVAECTWLVPVVGADVASVVSGNSTAVDDNTEEDETDNCSHLDQAKNELDLTIAADTEDVDNNDAEQEDCDPDTDVDGRSASVVWVGPEGDCDTGGGELEWQDDQPVHGIVPAHGKAPCRVNEPD